MREPSSQKKRRICLRQVEGIEGNVREKIPDVIQRHQDHHQTAQQIDRFQPGARGQGGWRGRMFERAYHLVSLCQSHTFRQSDFAEREETR